MHRNPSKIKKLSLKKDHRRLYIKTLLESIINSERIIVTDVRAKLLKTHFDKAVTLAKKNTLASRRLLLSRIATEDAVDKLLAEIVPNLSNRTSGYLTTTKIGLRRGDTTMMTEVTINFDNLEERFKQKENRKLEAQSKKSAIKEAKKQELIKKLESENKDKAKNALKSAKSEKTAKDGSATKEQDNE